MSRQEAFKELAPIARKIAQKFRSRIPAHEDTDDLTNVALMGVWEAVTRRYEAGMTAMTALAVVRARGAVIDHLRQRDWASRHVRKVGHPYAMLSLEDLQYDNGDPPFEILRQRRTPEDEASRLELDRKMGLALELALGELDARDRYVVRRLLAGAKNLDVANELKVSGARISQIIKRVLPKLRASVRATSRRGELW